MTQAVKNGFVKSKLAVAVLSPNFLCEYWTNFELDGIFSTKQYITGISGEQMILPLWNNVSAEDIAAKRPSLASLLAWNLWLDTVYSISGSVAEMIGKDGVEIDG